MHSRQSSENNHCRRMMLRSEHLERLAQGYYRASQDKSVPAEKRLKFRVKAMRSRALSRRFRVLESTEANPTLERP
jgi:hypothetical protein